MTSAKMNRAIMKSVFEDLSRADFDVTRAKPTPVNPGLFASEDDVRDGRYAPTRVIRNFMITISSHPKPSKQEIKHFVETAAWMNSADSVNLSIILDLAVGKSPKRHIQEAREAIEALRAIEEGGWANMYERKLKERMGEV